MVAMFSRLTSTNLLVTHRQLHLGGALIVYGGQRLAATTYLSHKQLVMGMLPIRLPK
jgi:hypothetical protein